MYRGEEIEITNCDDAGQDKSVDINYPRGPAASQPFNVRDHCRVENTIRKFVPSYLQALPLAADHNSKGGGYGVLEMNQGDRVACVLAGVDESIKCIGIVVAGKICELLQLWEKVVGGVAITQL